MDQDNKLKPVVMGSYGIGLERCMAAVVEQYHDDAGIIWRCERLFGGESVSRSIKDLYKQEKMV